MNIYVLLKQVPGTSDVKMDEETGTMIRTEHKNVINPLDENALAEAIRLRDLRPRAKVIAISMGPPHAQKAVREAIALGADGGVLLSHRGFGGSDTLATSKALARALVALSGGSLGNGDLILCGERATDGETGQVGPMVSAILDVPVVTYVRKISLEDHSVVAERVVEEGLELIKASLPAVVTVVKDINQPGFPTLSGKLKAKSKEIPVLVPDDLGLSGDDVGLSGSPTRVVKVFRPRLTRDTTIYRQDSTGNAVHNLMSFLEEQGVI
ncbi:MAG: electron transfer flavoprotein subunit beta/FixA family protein [Firmicutes bacterium]|nr:electron transfer flavoprotein subunit beta/FixA family protein [Bacillota bacterium]